MKLRLVIPPEFHDDIYGRPILMSGMPRVEVVNKFAKCQSTIKTKEANLKLGMQIGEDVMAAIRKDEYIEPRIINLSGTEGNAFVLLGIAQILLRKRNMDPDIYLQMMKADDYGNLVRMFDQLFGDLFTLVLPEDVDSLEDL